MRKYILTFILLSVVFVGVAQTSSPKREMRSGWLATVWNIDWPSASYKITTTGDEAMIKRQKNQMIATLDKMKAANINTVFFQIRSRSDAMYKSSYEPWSADLVTPRGLDPGYDPLAFVIEEAHKRGMELHAWMNPYRYESQTGQWTGENDYGKTHPEWLLRVKWTDSNGAQDAQILNPGLPEVRQRISDIVGEVVTNYEVDGIIFDDYFYLQAITNQDAATEAKYNTEKLSLGDWRRGNVNQMISDVYTRIKSIKPYVQFGASPAGIWDGGATVAATKYGVSLPVGVSSGGFQYHGIYSDPLAWMKAKTVDYISPQIYWATTHATAPYSPLSEWWSYLANVFGVQFYSSHSLTGVSGIPVPTKSAQVEGDFTHGNYGSMSQLESHMLAQSNLVETRATNAVASDYLLQVKRNREYDKNGAPGSVFYSVKSLTTTNFPEYLKANVFQNPALRPAIWAKNEGQEAFVSNIRVESGSLKWDFGGAYPRFTVYAIPNSEVGKVGNFAKSDYIVDIVYSTSIEIPANKPTSAYKYAVAVFDRFNNEYSPKLIGNETVAKGSASVLENPINNGGIVLPDNFKWQAFADAEFYIIEIAKDATFTDIFYRRELTDAFLAGDNLDMLKANEEYYWRVTTRRVSTEDAVSSASKFKALLFAVSSPTEGDETSVTPTITWVSLVGVSSYKVEIASNKNMTIGLVFSKENITETNCLVDAQKLLYGTKYYVRVTATLSAGGTKPVTELVQFITTEVVPPVPVITSPVNGATVGTTLNVKWDGTVYASKYEVELSTSASFPIKNTTTKVAPAFTNETNFDKLTAQTYYLRVRAYYGVNKTTEWSEVVQLSAGSSIDENGASILAYSYKRGEEAYVVINPIDNKPLTISLYSVSGMKLEDVVNSYVPAGGTEEFLLTSYEYLPKGVYILTVRFGEKMVNIKILK